MLRIGRPDLHAHGAVPRSHQIAVVGESRAEEGLTVHVVGTDFQAEPALQTFGHGVLMGMVTVRRRLVFPDVHAGLLQVLMNGGPVHDEVVDDREFPQGTDLYLLSLQVPHERIAGERWSSVDHHGARAADTLKAGTFPADSGRLLPIRIDDVIVIVDIVQHPCHGIVLWTVVREGFPVGGTDGRLLP